ncbi:MAG: GNAT family N-acetyltransferase [bacterium]|nr:GNAT family N-acetyltransferase [bacterium]
MAQTIAPTDRGILAPLFADHRPSFLIDAILEGHLGTAIADDSDAPNVARLAYADIIVLGGEATHPAAIELLMDLPVEKGILPAPGEWRNMLFRIHGERLIEVERFAFSDRDLNLKHLLRLRDDLKPGFQLRRMDNELARQIAADDSLISEDHVRNFDSPDDFVERGIGFCILKDGRIISGASSYAFCNSGIEVQVNTHEDYRKLGLATVAGAALLAHCLERGVAAHWDAGNPISAKLAEKLGYLPSGTYEMFVRIG